MGPASYHLRRHTALSLPVGVILGLGKGGQGSHGPRCSLDAPEWGLRGRRCRYTPSRLCLMQAIPGCMVLPLSIIMCSDICACEPTNRKAGYFPPTSSRSHRMSQRRGSTSPERPSPARSRLVTRIRLYPANSPLTAGNRMGGYAAVLPACAYYLTQAGTKITASIAPHHLRRPGQMLCRCASGVDLLAPSSLYWPSHSCLLVLRVGPVSGS